MLPQLQLLLCLCIIIVLNSYCQFIFKHVEDLIE